MNLANITSEFDSGLLFVNFNQDCSSIAVGTKTGFKLYSLTKIDCLELIYSSDLEDVCIIERLFNSSLIAIVTLAAPRRLTVCHYKKDKEICNYNYSNTINSVRLNKQRLVVCLEESVHIHNIRDMTLLHSIKAIPSNPHGLCCLSSSNDNCFMAYPCNNKIGEVHIFDVLQLKSMIKIPAHDNPLASLAFNFAATLMATASEKGTVIRVFSVPMGEKLFEFRRGVKRCVSVSSLSFIQDNNFLSVSSNTETIHIFKLVSAKEKEEKRVSDQQSGTWMSYVQGALKSSANYLPTQVSDMLQQDRDFATAKLPVSGLQNVAALSIIQRNPRLLVACQDGYLYIYSVNPEDGGECQMIKRYQLNYTGDADYDDSFNLAPSSLGACSSNNTSPVSALPYQESSEYGSRNDADGSDNEFPSSSIDPNVFHSMTAHQIS